MQWDWKTALHVVIYIFAAIGFILVAGYFAVKFGLTNTTGIIDQQRQSFLSGGTGQAAAVDESNALPWTKTEEWATLDAAIRKDTAPIARASADAGVPARLIVANLVTEQLRLFFTDRADYKQFFLPLQIL